MQTIRRWIRAGLVAVVAVSAVACSSGSGGEQVLPRELPTDTLECARPVGPPGQGTVKWHHVFGMTVRSDHAQLRFDRGALQRGTRVTVTPIDSPHVAIRIGLDPQPDSFKPARLRFDIRGCPAPTSREWIIWRMPDQGDTHPPEPLDTELIGDRWLQTYITRNSFFIIAN